MGQSPSLVVQDFVHQQYVSFRECHLHDQVTPSVHLASSPRAFPPLLPVHCSKLLQTSLPLPLHYSAMLSPQVTSWKSMKHRDFFWKLGCWMVIWISAGVKGVNLTLIKHGVYIRNFFMVAKSGNFKRDSCYLPGNEVGRQSVSVVPKTCLNLKLLWFSAAHFPAAEKVLWSLYTMSLQNHETKCFGHLKTRLFTIKASEHVGLGGPWYIPSSKNCHHCQNHIRW